jgi:agmatinase
MNSCPAFLESERPNAAPDLAAFHVIPVPMEMGISYGRGTSEGPAAILEASTHLEVWDGEGIPVDSGIHTAEFVDCSGGVQDVLGRIEAAVRAAFGAEAIPVLLGGEHTVSLGALEATAGVFGAGKVGIVQFDAHADLRDSYGGNPYSHACVMRRGVELGFPLFQVGVRSLSPEEVEFRARHRIPCLDAREAAGYGAARSGRKAADGQPVRVIELPGDFPDLVYLSFDVDGLDPSIVPSTGTPEPGGLGWYQALSMIESVVASGRRIVGFDVVELAPDPGSRMSDFTCARLVYDIMGIAIRGPVQHAQ